MQSRTRVVKPVLLHLATSAFATSFRVHLGKKLCSKSHTTQTRSRELCMKRISENFEQVYENQCILSETFYRFFPSIENIRTLDPTAKHLTGVNECVDSDVVRCHVVI